MKSKAKDFVLFIICLLYWVFRGDRKKAPNEISNLVIFRSKPHIGDMVYVTPLFRAIKTKYPKAHVTVIGNIRAKELIEHNPFFDTFFAYQGNFIATLKILKKLNLDFACLANLGSIEGLTLLYLSGAKCISVFEDAESGNSWMYRILKNIVATTKFKKGVYVPPIYLALLDPISANTKDCHFNLYFSDEAKHKIHDIYSKQDFKANGSLVVGIAPGGSTIDRWWPAKNYATISNWLAESYHAKIVFIGVGQDKKAIDTCISGLNRETSYINFYNQSLDEFKATISSLDLIVGNDSGPMVTADAFDIPQLVLVGPTNALEYHLPPGQLNRIIKATDGRIESIQCESVITELQDLLDNMKS